VRRSTSAQWARAAAAVRRSARLHASLETGAGLAHALAPYRSTPASAIAPPGRTFRAPGWAVREDRLTSGLSRYVFERRPEARS
jgi:hypothetical protein